MIYKNALIERTFLGIEAHGLFSFALDMNYGDLSQRSGKGDRNESHS